MKGLTLLTKTSQRGRWNIAAYHNPHSLTWSWIVSFARFTADEARVRPLWFSYRTNDGLQWGFRVPFLGIIQWSRQQPMYFRDMYYRQRDEEDRASYQRSIVRQKQPVIVVDNSQALH